MYESLAQKPRELRDQQIPLCVDLDYSLIKTDLLFESCVLLLQQKPWYFLIIPLWLLRGRVALKEELARRVDLRPELLPYNEEVFFFLKRQALRGRKIYLVTGSSKQCAQQIADYLGIFTDVFASQGTTNLVGVKKAEFLVEKFGEGQFDYIGDGSLDLYVWQKARYGYVVSSRHDLVEKAKKVTRVRSIFSGKKPFLKIISRSLRIHQWVKNLLVFAPAILAFGQVVPSRFISCVFAFFSLSLLASAHYILNDLLDLHHDRQHPDKKNRPFASGDLSLGFALVAIPVLLALSLVIALPLGATLIMLLLVYGVVTNLYSLILKKIVIADIFVLASLYSWRLVIGGVAAQVPLSPWLIAFSGLFFLSLAVLKRVSELKLMCFHPESSLKGRGYMGGDLTVLVSLGLAAGYGSIVVLALYIQSPLAHQAYHNAQWLWFFCPVLIYWLSRIWLWANRGMVDSDPIVFAIRDKVSIILLCFIVGIWFLAR